MYSIAGYAEMIADRVRLEAFAQALRRSVRPDSVVVDLGAGTGIFALMAARLGARRVYAIEEDDIIQVATRMAAANGLAGSIEFIQQKSRHVCLPETADVLVSDMGGVVPVHGDQLVSLMDARSRLLRPGGAVIPRTHVLSAAVAAAPEIYRKHVEPWQGLDWNAGPLRELLCNSCWKVRVAPGDLVSEPATWLALDNHTVDRVSFRGALAWEIGADSVAHGIVLWCESMLVEGVILSSRPGAAEVIYGSVLFPWPRPVGLKAGAPVEVMLRADYTGEGYVWTWETEAGGHKFRQSTFGSVPLSAGRLRRRAPQSAPGLGRNGRIDLLALQMMGGGISVGEVARELRRQFPADFPLESDALARAADLADRSR